MKRHWQILIAFLIVALPVGASYLIPPNSVVTASIVNGAVTAAKMASSFQPVASLVRQVFTTGGTYTPTSGMVYVDLECVGGGGGSGGITGATSTAYVSGSGAGGTYERRIVSAATIGSSQSVTIGAAGAAGSTGNHAGGAGGSSSFGSILTGPGGGGGGYGAGVPGSGTACSGTYDYCIIGNPGQLGAAYNEGVTGASYMAILGVGGSSFWGGASSSATIPTFIVTSGNTNGVGAAGSAYGGGAGSSYSINQNGTTVAGAAGSAGQCVATEYVF